MITLSKLREGLNLPADQDAKLTRIRAGLISLWEGKTGLKWDARTGYVQTIEPDTKTCDTVFLDLIPVTSITLVEVRDLDCIPSADWTELEADDYILMGRRSLRRLDQRFWPTLVRVTYSGGAAEADVDIQEALILQGRFMQARMAPDKLIVKSQNFEGGGGVFETATMHPKFAEMVKDKARKG